MLIRLQKFLAEAGIASRRKAEEMILDSRITVNGKKITELGTKIDPEKDKVAVDKKIIKVNAEKVYYLLNKPVGYMTTTKDPHAEHTVLELVDTDKRIFPVGRLDKDTTGLLILTNDGEFANKLTHPRYEKEKEYEVVCRRQLTGGNVEKFENGLIIDGKKTAPAKIKIIKETKEDFIYSITIKEGRNRQIRKMLEAVGNKVTRLSRVRVSNLSLGNLKEGEWRRLKNFEANKLMR